MKKTVIRLTVLAALLATTYLANQLHAQNQQPRTGQVQQTTATAQPAPLRTRIAVINLQQVIKQYRKWNDFEKSYKDAYTYYQGDFDRK